MALFDECRRHLEKNGDKQSAVRGNGGGSIMIVVLLEL